MIYHIEIYSFDYLFLRLWIRLEERLIYQQIVIPLY